MALRTACKMAISVLALSALAACGGGFGSPATERPDQYTNPNNPNNIETNPDNTIWSIFNRKNTDSSVSVNKYLWSASLEVLNFLPVQSVDPFTGVIVTGYGTPPGGGRAYRATVLIDDPALPYPIRAALFQNSADAASWSLHWNRPPKRDAKD